MNDITEYRNENLYYNNKYPNLTDNIILQKRGKLEKQKRITMLWKKYLFMLENDQLSYYLERNQVILLNIANLLKLMTVITYVIIFHIII